MLNKKEIERIRDFLNASQNPCFFFDNDCDGLCSFILFRKFINKGKGVVIKSFPELNETYLRKINEFNPDHVFILDKPLVSEKFIQGAEQLNVSVTWIDHHPEQNPKDFVNYFNPLSNKPKSNEPIAYWAYKITGQQKYMWISMIGCIGDWFLPDFSQKFAEQYPDLFDKNIENGGDALYKTKAGEITNMLNFALKDKTTNVIKMLKFLIEAETPYELLEENEKNKSIFRRYRIIKRKYDKLLEKAKKFADRTEKLLFFKYSGDLSISGELSNELLYLYPKKVIAIGFLGGERIKVSLRASINIRDLIMPIAEELGGSSGGHENACAAHIPADKIDEFEKKLKEIL